MATVLHIIDTKGPGGAETVFLNLLNAFDSGGFRSIPLVSADGWIDRTLRVRGKATETSDSSGSFNTSYLRSIMRAVRRYRVDVVQAHLPGPNVYGSLAGVLTGVPVVSTFHGAVDLLHEGRLRDTKLRVVNLGSRRIVAVSNSLRRDLERLTSLDSSKMQVIHNGVDVDAYRRHTGPGLRDELGLPPEAVLVVSVGNIRPAKGYDVLIRAAARLKGVEMPIHFAIAGDPRRDLYQELQALRAREDVSGTVHFLGFRQDAASVLGSADLFLLPSTSEGFSISTIEAMAAGIPVVVTRSGGPEEIVDAGVNGVLVPPGDPAAIAEAVLALARDPERGGRLAAAARLTVERRFSLGAMVSGYAEMYGSLLRGRASGWTASGA